MPMRPPLRRRRRAPPPSRSTRATSPMSSTPQAPQGRQKGLALRMPAFRNLAGAQIERFAIDGQSRVLQFASPSFDAVISEIATVLLSGAALVVPPGERSGRVR